MQKKQVAVIDVGSAKITALLGERGINKTFVIKGKFVYEYDGYADGEFFDKDKFQKILFLATEKLSETAHSKLDVVYVGVPGEFTSVEVKDSQISFPKKKKITPQDMDTLFDGGFVLRSNKHTLINRSAVVYELDDFRRLANPVGAVSGILKGKLSFITCDNKFLETVVSPIRDAGANRVECVSTSLAEALYLVDPEIRDRVAIITDIGYISTTLSIVQGDGIIYQKAFGYGGGYVTAELSSIFDLDFKVAEKLKRKINLCSLNIGGSYNVVEIDNEYFNTDEVKNAVITSLDGLCETLTKCLDESGLIVPDYVPLSITGGGITCIRGAKEHISNRLGMMVEVLMPKVPMLDTPTESSALSLLDLALEQN